MCMTTALTDHSENPQHMKYRRAANKVDYETVIVAMNMTVASPVTLGTLLRMDVK